ncbi:MAG TPA: TonB-dependent receptor [Leptolyngbyaceae cyanobacterium]
MKRQPLIPSLLLTSSVATLIAIPAQAQVAQVTDVRLNQTPSGLQVILETQDSRPLQSFTASNGRIFIADIITTQLRLPDGGSFRADNPAPGISSVQVIPLDTNSIRVRIVSETDTPVAQIQKSDRDFILSVNTTPGTTATRPTPTTPQPVDPGLVVPPTDPNQPTQPGREPGAVITPTQPTPTQPGTEPGAVITPTQPTPTQPGREPGITVPLTTPSQTTQEPLREETIELIVTATRTAEEITNIPRSVTVVTREQIQEQTAISRNLADILSRTVPGFGPPNSGNRFNAQNLRGRPPQILIDGVPQQGNSANNVQLGYINPASVERVEVVRGPTAIYGQGATGGTINIITRRPTEGRPVLTTEIGVNTSLSNFFAKDSFGGVLNQSITGSQGIFDYAASFSGTITNSFYDASGLRIPSDNATSDDTRSLNFLGKVGVNFDPQQRLQLTVNYVDNERDIQYSSDRSILDIPGTQIARAIRQPQNYIGTDESGIESTLVNLIYSHENVLGSQVQVQGYYRQSSDLSIATDDRRLFSRAIGRFRSSEEVFGTRLQIETPLFETVKLLWGADYEYQKNGALQQELFDPEAYDSSGGRTLQKIGQRDYRAAFDLADLGLFAQLQWDATDRLILSGGVRHERFKFSTGDFTPSFNRNFTPFTGDPIQGGELDFTDTVFNAGVVYKITRETSVFANFAQGFSVPGFFSALTFVPEGFSIQRDIRELQPQKVDNYEIGVRGNWSNVQASIAGFYNYSDLGLSLVARPDGAIEYSRAPQRNYGVEATIDWQPAKKWQVGASLSYTFGENDEDGDGDFIALRSFEVQPWKLTGYVEHQTTPGWRNRLQVLYVGNRDDAFEVGKDPVAVNDYLLLDFISSIQLGRGTLFIGIENLLNNQYSSVFSQLLGGFSELNNRTDRGMTLSVKYQLTW